MTNNISTIVNTIAATTVTTIFDRIAGEAYDASCDRLVKAHMIKVMDNSGMAKVCDLVDLRLAAGDDWHAITDEGLVVEGTDEPLNDFKSMYRILNGLHNGAGLSWDEIKASLVSDEEAWI